MNGGIIGRWTTIREWMGIDLLALDAWSAGAVIGYEVKVSRADMRTELLKPHKRLRAVQHTTHFYFAVPKGLFTFEELAYTEPEWSPEDWQRVPCPWPCRKRSRKKSWSVPPERRLKGYLKVPVPVVLQQRDLIRLVPRYHDEKGGGWTWVKCPNCKGKAWIEKSRVEREAPTLWVPNDVGLIEIDGRGCHVVRESPTRKEPKIFTQLDPAYYDKLDPETTNRLHRQHVNVFARWVSARPDPRHRGMKVKETS